MFEGGAEMPEPGYEREDELERLLAAEEAAIADGGFSARVVQAASRTGSGRKLTLYGAGMIGFGVAAGSLSEAAAESETFAAWVEQGRRFLDTPQLPAALQVGDTGLIVLAGCIGLVFSVVALVAQTR